MIGINLSNYVLGDFTLDTSFGQVFKALMNYILKETNLQILLIPHVTWKGQDDRIVAQNVKALYSNSNRIQILDIKHLNYCQIRFIISNCKYFIGARTHAVISAYSTCIPTMALGYSIKSRGIAKDIGMSDKLVVNCKRQLTVDDLINTFEYMCHNENVIRSNLKQVMIDYCKKPYQINDFLSKI